MLWGVLTGGDRQSLAYGAVAAVVATLIAVRLRPTTHQVVLPWRVALFFGPFLSRGLRGALDVSRRALDPRLPVEPAWVRFRLSQRDGATNSLFGGVISVLPGTLAAGPTGGTMMVHVLHATGFDVFRLQAEEDRVLRLFRRRRPTETADG